MTKYINPSHIWDTRLGELEIASGDLSETLSLGSHASYIIFKDRSGKICAKNGETGVIEFSGMDAATVIQDAMDALAGGGGGGIIHIKAGTYLIESEINLSCPGCVIEGVETWVESPSNKGTILKAGDGVADGNILRISGFLSGARYIAIDGTGVSNVTGIYIDAQDGHVNRVAVKGCKVGIWLWGSMNKWITNSWIEWNSYHIRSQGVNWVWILNNIFAAGTYAIHFNGGQHAWIMNNKFESGSRFFGTGGSISDFIFAGNQFYSVTDVVYRFDNNASHIRLLNEIVDGGGQTEYYLQTLSGVTITDGKVVNCSFRNMKSGVFNELGGKFEKWGNYGYVTENSGTATISAGSTSVTVSHGLADTPSEVLVTPIGDPGSRFWVANVTSTSFDIVVATAPTADIDFYWRAEL